jgi:trans-2,3-dihydro-3-hydroxyanthranilate isomerase
MHQIPPSFGKTYEAEDIAPVLNLKLADIDDKYPIQEVSTGVLFLIVPLKTLRAVKRCHVNRTIEKNKKAPSDFLVFCPETYKKENDLNVRVFVDLLGIPEDPATGSGNGCLAGYLVRHHYFSKDSINVKVEQGYEINRPSLLHLKAKNMKGEIEVYVGGRVFLVAEGELV